MTVEQPPVSAGPDKSRLSIQSFTPVFRWGGIFLLVISVFHLFSLLTAGYNPERLWNFASNLVYGGGFLFCYQLLLQKKAVVVWIYAALGLISIARSVMLGNTINMLIVIIVNGYLFSVLFMLKKQGDLK